MAINTESVKQKRYGFFDQATWGTIAADSVNLTNAQIAPQGFQLDIDPFSIAPNVNIREGKPSHGTRRPVTLGQVHDTYGSCPSISLPAFEAKKDTLDFFLYAIMQAVSEGISTPFVKTFTIPVGQPDFTANGGFFMTFWERFYTASKSRKLKDVIGRNLTLTIEPGGRLMVSGELIGRGAMTENANPSGTWTRADSDNADFFFFENINRFNINTGSGDMAHRLTGPFEITLANDALPFGLDGSGNRESFLLSNWKLDLKFQVQDDPTANIRNPLEAAHRLGTVCSFEIGWGVNNPPTTDGELEISGQFQITEVTPDDADLLGVQVTGRIATNDTANSPITIIMANAIDRVW